MLNEFTERILAVCGRSALNAIGPFMHKKAGGLTCFCFWGGGLNAFVPFVAVQHSAIPTLLAVMLRRFYYSQKFNVWFFIIPGKFSFCFLTANETLAFALTTCALKSCPQKKSAAVAKRWNQQGGRDQGRGQAIVRAGGVNARGAPMLS